MEKYHEKLHLIWMIYLKFKFLEIILVWIINYLCYEMGTCIFKRNTLILYFYHIYAIYLYL